MIWAGSRQAGPGPAVSPAGVLPACRTASATLPSYQMAPTRAGAPATSHADLGARGQACAAGAGRSARPPRQAVARSLAQAPAADRRDSARSVRSQEKSGSSLPK